MIGDTKKYQGEIKKTTAVDWSKKTVLLVEDDRTHRALMDKILRECLFKTVLAENGFIALSKLESGAVFDLILMDWDMPELNGLETVREIRRRQADGVLPYIPVVAFTSHRQPGDREKCLAAGMDAYLPKDIWLPHWRQTLIDNLLQGLIVGDFNAQDINTLPSDSTEQQNKTACDLDAFDSAAFDQTAALLKQELPIAIEEYLEDAAAYIRDIREGLETGSAEKAGRGSHTLKSNSKGFGLSAVSRIAEKINHLARQGNLEDIAPLFPQLQEAFHRAEKKLRDSIRFFNR